MSLFQESHPAAVFADVILPLSLPGELTYGVPEEWRASLLPGMRVEVALGKNRQYAGIVARIHNEKPAQYEVKPIRAVMDDLPVVSSEQLRFWEWIARYYAAAPGEVMQAALPAHLKLANETRLQWAPRHAYDGNDNEWSAAAQPAVAALVSRGAISITDLRSIVGRKYLIQVLHELLDAETVIINDALEPSYRPKTERVIELMPEYQVEGALEAVFDTLQRAPKQMEALLSFIALAQKNPVVRQAEMLADGRVAATQIKALADRGVFHVVERDVDRVAFTGGDGVAAISFTPAQAAAFKTLEEGLSEKGVVLLQGVTGSGKTLLYIQKIRDCIAAGTQALLLLPEIGLTTQLVRRLYAYFGDELGVYHSRFSNNERVEIWDKVQRGKYKVVVGPRSAIWLPFNKLGVIICDEEHDGSYKQRDPAPRFHARDAAVYLAGLHRADVILGSATPSVESLYNVRQGKYAYAALKERYLGVQMPAIEIVNATSIGQVRKLGFQILTPELQAAMAEALAAKRQIILFQNRRGYAPFQICNVCGWVPQCKNCAVSLTYHKADDKLHCHYCGLREPPTQTCAQCGSNRISFRSFGTEKIEEEVKTAFPTARVARMDIDSMRGRNALSQLLDSMEAQQTDILVGTQMVVKGLDFAPVALVAILSADSLLSFPDFRVNERGFQLMEQVAGRAGRGDGKGRVIIQAYNLQHPALQWVVDHDVGAFYRHEIGYREFFNYPPFSRMIKVIVRHKEEEKAVLAATAMAEALSQSTMGNGQPVGDNPQSDPSTSLKVTTRTPNSEITIQGPVPAMIPRVRNFFVQEIWLKCPRDGRLLDELKNFLKEQRVKITATRGLRDVQVVIDVDPV